MARPRPSPVELVRDLPEAWTLRQRMLVGVSGGLDSMVLVQALLEAGFKRLVICHLDHGLRGRHSTADARWVRDWAEKHDCECEIGYTEVKKLAKTTRQSIETAARDARYEFFEQAAKKWRCPRLILAHHADDQAETVLMAMGRGTGLRGLGGMRPLSQRNRLCIWRPLFPLTREDLTTWAAEREISFREDASNADLTYLRNRLRHQALPQLSDLFQRDIRPALCRLAEAAQRDEALLESLTDEAWKLCAHGQQLKVSALRPLAEAIVWRVVARWLKEQGVPEISAALLGDVVSLVPSSATASKINLPHDHWARRTAGWLWIDGPKS